MPTTAMNGTSTLYSHLNFSLYYLLMNYFPTYAAYIVNYAITIVMGTVAMHCLLKKIFKFNPDDCLYMIIALTYAFLPIYPPAGQTFAVLPFYVILMMNAWNDKKANKKYLICIVFPF